MDNSFRYGLQYAAAQLGTQFSGLTAETFFDEAKEEYIGEIETEINKLIDNLFSRVTKLDGRINNSTIPSLAGKLFEEWSAGTYNINATAARKSPMATVPRENGYASPDVMVGNVPYSAKAYKTAKKSFREQAETPFERYKDKRNKFLKKHPDKSYMSESEFYQDKSRNVAEQNAHLSMYHGQKMLVPRDQLQVAKKLAKQYAERNKANGDMVEAKRYQELVDKLTDRIRENGVEGIPIDKEDLFEITRMVKKALEDGDKSAETLRDKLKELGIDAETMADISLLFTGKDIIDQMLVDGMKAGVIALLLSVAPVLIEGILQLVRTGEIDRETLSTLGTSAAKGSALGFITGSLTSCIILCGKTGRLGESVLKLMESPNSKSVISAGVVLCINSILCCCDLAAGKINKAEFADYLSQNIIITIGSTLGGILLSAAVSVPVLHGFMYMLGSFIGSIISGFLYHSAKELLLSFCVDSGWTFFGLVEQDYCLPTKALEQLGIEVPELGTFTPDSYDIDHPIVDTCRFDPCETECCDIRVLSRGFIGVRLVGYC